MTDLVEEQVALELRMAEAGAERYWRDFYASAEKGRGAGTKPASNMIGQLMPKFAEALEAFIADAQARAGVRHTAAKYLKDADPKVSSMLTLQAVFNTVMGAKAPTVTRLAMAIASALEDEAALQDMREQDRDKFKRLKQLADDRTGYHFKRSVFKYAGVRHDFQLDWKDWPQHDKIKIGLKLIDILITEFGVLQIETSRRGKNQQHHIRLSDQAKQWVENANEHAQWMRPYYEPMIVPPKPWVSTTEGGYLTSNVKPLTMIKTWEKGWLREHTPSPEVLEAINTAQATPWKINTFILELLQEMYAAGSSLGDLPSCEPLPQPYRDPNLVEGTDAFGLWKFSMRKWYEAEEERASRATQFKTTLDIADRYRDRDAIYFPMNYDFRGRMYAVTQLSPQGSDWCKALLKFAEGKPITDEGGAWLAIHLANCADLKVDGVKLSKRSLEERCAWTYQNSDMICACASDPFTNLQWTEMDAPFQFLAAAEEWMGYRYIGPDYVSHLPIALDGSCSGIQHFSMAFRDEIGGQACNLIPGAQAADIYQMVADLVQARLEDNVKAGGYAFKWKGQALNSYDLAIKWLEFGIDRSLCKRPTMTFGYGSKAFGFSEQIMDDTLDGNPDAERIFGDDIVKAAGFMGRTIEQAIQDCVVKAAEAMTWLQDAAADKGTEPIIWFTPDGFMIRQAYHKMKTRRVAAIIGGSRFTVQTNETLPEIDPRKQRQGIAPNWVHSLDACHLRMTVVAAAQEGISSFALVHDSFGVHAADTPRFFSLLRETFVHMYEEHDPVRDFILDLGVPETIVPPEAGNLDPQAVLDSDFCFS